MKFKKFLESYNIFVDMDGTITDFDKAFKDITGQLPDKYEEEYGRSALWIPINLAGQPFWENMKWLKDGKELWKYVKKHNPTILSSPSNEKSSVTGKEKWLKKNLMGVKYILDHNKHQYVKNGEKDILIDDTPKKIKLWRGAGGTGILHKSTQNTIKELKKLGV
jgi:5'(3')-deoxyribonucleotidase